jgi:hypothetical protein
MLGMIVSSVASTKFAFDTGRQCSVARVVRRIVLAEYGANVPDVLKVNGTGLGRTLSDIFQA